MRNGKQIEKKRKSKTENQTKYKSGICSGNFDTSGYICDMPCHHTDYRIVYGPV